MSLKLKRTVSSSLKSSATLGVCAICKDLPEESPHSTTCGHVFHGGCIKKWLDNSTVCPVCRSNIDVESLVRIYPGSVNRDEVVVANELLTDDELKSLTLEAFKAQNIVYNQLSMLGEKINVQTSYIEELKGKLQDKDKKYKFVEGQKEQLERNLYQLKNSHEDLQMATTKMASENSLLENKLEEIDATIEIMNTLVEQHKLDCDEAQHLVGQLESELETLNQACGGWEETISKLELIRYEVDEGDRSMEDFVEDLIAENRTLKISLAEAEAAVGDQACAILDHEMNVDTLKETLNDIQESYADQSAESKKLEASLRTMQRLHQQQSEELKDLNSERDVYQNDIKDMLGHLKSTEETLTTVDKTRRESEMLNISYQGQLAQTLASIEHLKKEKEDAVKMLALKEDVIGTLQKSVESTTNVYLERLEKFSNSETASVAGEVLQKTNRPEEKSDILVLIDSRFKALADEIERKDNLLLLLMNEKSEIEENISVQEQISTLELQDQIAALQGRLSSLEQHIRAKDNSIEEKEMVITHLVSVVNRYAFNDKDDGTIQRRSVKRTSEPQAPPTSEISLASSGQRTKTKRQLSLQVQPGNKEKKEGKKEGRRVFSTTTAWK